MEQKNFLLFVIILLCLILTSNILTKSLSLSLKLLTTFIIILITSILFFFYDKLSSQKKTVNKNSKTEKEKEKEKLEQQKQISFQSQINNLKKYGIEQLNLREIISNDHIVTSINNFQNDKIMLTMFGGRVIIYSVDKLNYIFKKLLEFKEFTSNTYNSIQYSRKTNQIIVCGFPCIKIIEISINNNESIEGNSYKVIQYLDSSKYSKEIIKVIEFNSDTLISISTDYLLFWKKNSQKRIFEIDEKKIINYTKNENSILINNIIKIDDETIVILKQSNSNLTKSTINFVNTENLNDIKTMDLNITPLENYNNNLLLINKKTFCVGCIDKLAIFSVDEKEIIQLIEFEYPIKNIDIYFDDSLILFSNYEAKKEFNEFAYNFIQLRKSANNKNDFVAKKVCKKSGGKKEFEGDLTFFKCLNDGIIIIGDNKGKLQLWH